MTSDERQARLAKVYDAEILPAYAGRFGALLGRIVAPPPAARIVELGCATGDFTRALARRCDGASQITALDDSPLFLDEARARLAIAPVPAAPVTFSLLPAGGPSPLAPAGTDLLISNLWLAGSPEPATAIRNAARLVAPGGRLALTAPLAGSWGEFLDLFRDVLREGGKQTSLDAADRYVASLPDGDDAVAWLERAGLEAIEIVVERWEILFKSAREFFFAPLVELGPLPHWKRLSGGGDEMQDVFFFTKEAIDTYFAERAFAVTIVGAALQGRKPA